MWDEHDAEQVEPFRVTPGFIAFAGAIFLPIALGLAIVIGAWMVSDEVYAAETAAARAGTTDAGEDVEGWKKDLVLICPLH